MSTCLSLPATLPLFLISSPPSPGGKTRHMLIEIAASLKKKKGKKKEVDFRFLSTLFSAEGM